MAQDPMASDRRVLIIGVVSMVVFAAVGVTGAALFTGSACADIEPEPIVRSASVGSPEQVLGDLLDDQPAERQAALLASVAELESTLGTATGAAEVTGAQALLGLDDGRVVAAGTATRVIAAAGNAVDAVAGFPSPARVVGGGDGLFALAWINDLTGQIDALASLDRDLDAGTCVDTAVVGEPFAFHLDAGGGDLLLFRVEEDAAAPEVERRGSGGRSWSVPVDVPTAPPGILAERVSAQLASQVVVARRIIPGETSPAVTAFDRASGDLRWEVGVDEVMDRVGGTDPLWLEVAAVGEDVAILGVSRDLGEQREFTALLAIDVPQGRVRWDIELDGEVTLADVAIGPGAIAVALGGDDRTEVRTLAVDDGATVANFEPLSGTDAGIASRADGSAILTTAESIAILSADGRDLRPTTVPDGVRDVVVTGGSTTVLQALPGGTAVAITFGG